MAESKTGRDRSPSFPFIPLKTAIERLVAFEEHYSRTSVAPGLVGQAWDMKPNSSQAQQTLAALKAFGLLVAVRSPEAGVQVRVSPDGRNYLVAQQESTKQEIIKRAALAPKQIESHWKQWGVERPKDAACMDQLTIKDGFTTDAAKIFLWVYDETIAYVNLVDSDNINDAEGPPKPEENPIGEQLSPTGKVRVMDGERVVFTEEGQPNQYLKLIASGEFDDTLLEALEDFVKRQRKRRGILPQSSGRLRPSPALFNHLFNQWFHILRLTI